MRTMHKWFIPYRFAVPADLEAWLEDQARRGWVLSQVGQWSSIRMTFQVGESATYRYVVDLQARVRPDYLATYQDFGWEHVGQMYNVVVWRRPYNGARPEAFTDSESLRARSRRFQIPIAAIAVLCAIGALVEVAVGLFADLSDGGNTEHLASGGLGAVMAVALGVVARRIGRASDR